MDPSPQQIQELRTKFLLKLETDGAPAPEGFHAADLAKVKNGDDWLRRFLVHCEMDMNVALSMLWDTCEWRSKFGTNEITENNVKREYLEDGSLFVHNRDIDGRSLLIFNCKKHVKGQRDMDDLRRCVVYWFERLERLDKGKPVTIFFDMAETGLANMDMEFTKYLISLFKQYYPDFLNYIIIFEMPWILNAAFKIIKSWLPAKAVQKIRFVNKSSLKTVVTPDQALKVWGGQDDYTFSFVPEQKTSASTERTDKKVHFADGSPLNESFPGGFGDAQNKQDGLPSNNVSLQITPSDAISFTVEGTEMTGAITLTNNDDKIISYKIKTTSPEKFRVRPSTGVLASSESVSINVVLQPGYQLAGLSRDKFLIMNLPVDSTDMSPQELAELWKQTSGKNVGHHRLKCNLGSATPESALKNGTAFSSPSMDLEQQIRQISSGVSQLRDHHEKLCADLRFTQKLQWLTIGIVLLGFILAIFFSQRHSAGESCFAG